MDGRRADEGRTRRRTRALAVVALAAALGLLGASRRRGEPGEPLPAMRIDPNSAPAGVLSSLPLIGPTRAGAIVREREKEPFASLDDLERRVRGIGPATAAMLRPHLAFGDPSSPRKPAD